MTQQSTHDYGVVIEVKGQKLFHQATNIHDENDLRLSILDRIGRVKEKDNMQVEVYLKSFEEHVTLDSTVFSNCMGEHMKVRVIDKTSSELVSAPAKSPTTKPAPTTIHDEKSITVDSSSEEEFDIILGGKSRKALQVLDEQPRKKRRRTWRAHEDRKILFFSTSASSMELKYIPDQFCSGFQFNISITPRNKNGSPYVSAYLSTPSVNADLTLHADFKVWLLEANDNTKVLVFHRHIHLKSHSKYGGYTTVKRNEMKDYDNDGNVNWCAEISKVRVSDWDANCSCTLSKCCCGSNKALL